MDDEHCYRAISSRDGRFDGAFFTAVVTTGIYCRPSCPAMTPKRANVRFYPTAAAAQEAGFRACKRCRPDAAPGSAEWVGRADVVARAMRLIGDGVVEREGVTGLARRLGYSTRQVHRLVFSELGTGPLSLARAHRIQHARMLLETTDMPVTDVAWSAGFGSIRQFNDCVRQVYASSPSELRRRGAAATARGASGTATEGRIEVHLSYRPPFDLAAILDFLGQRAIPGVESWDGVTFSRVVTLPRGNGIISFDADRPKPRSRPGYLACRLQLDDNRDFIAAVSRIRRLLDLDADPVAVNELLRGDPLMSQLIAKRPGLRVPGAVDGSEIAMRAVLGQQVSVSGARTLAGRLALGYGRRLPEPAGALTHAFPTADAVAGADPRGLPLPASRAAALVALSASIAGGGVNLDPGADRDEAEAALRDLAGIGPWTSSYVRMRALGDPDVFMASDLGVKRALATATSSPDPERWRPWRSYATVHLWAASPDGNQTRKEPVTP